MRKREAHSRQRPRPTEAERQAAREYLEHDHARRHLTGQPAQEAHHHAEQVVQEHPRARLIALAGGPTDLGRLPRHLRAHQMSERRAAGITSHRAAELRRRGYPEETATRRRTPRERAEDTLDTARERTSDIVSGAAGAAADSSWGQLLGDFFMWGFGLSIAYLLLVGRGPRAVDKLAQGASNVTRAVISPVVDPLNPKGAHL